VSYYYLVASLPTLVMGEPPPFSGSEMLVRYANTLAADDAREVKLALEKHERGSQHPFLVQWVRADTQMRNAIARVRAGRQSVEVREYLHDHPGYDVGLENAVVDAYARPNPLERELALDHHRWKMLDEMVLAEPFGLGAVLAFAIKLRMVIRWAAVTEEAGARKLEELVAGLLHRKESLGRATADAPA
jgi:hypothetical protein